MIHTISQKRTCTCPSFTYAVTSGATSSATNTWSEDRCCVCGGTWGYTVEVFYHSPKDVSVKEEKVRSYKMPKGKHIWKRSDRWSIPKWSR